MELIDAHTHLQDERLADQVPDSLERAQQAGVTACICCGTSEEDWPAVANLADRYSMIIPAFGLHPWYVHSRSPRWREALSKYLEDFPQAAVGEAGLDHALKDHNDEEQAEIFAAQAQLAEQLQRPLVIHCRRAWQALEQLLTSRPTLPAGFMIHAYSGSAEMIPTWIQLGGYLSFGCSLTRSGNHRGRKAARATPADRLLLETDSPDIPPDPNFTVRDLPPFQKDTPNEPCHLPLALHALAQARETAPELLAQQLLVNTRSFFTF